MFSLLLILNIVSNVMFAIGMVTSKFKPQDPGKWWNIKFEEEDEEESAGQHKVVKKNSLNTILGDD